MIIIRNSNIKNRKFTNIEKNVLTCTLPKKQRIKNHQHHHRRRQNIQKSKEKKNRADKKHRERGK